MKNIIHFLTLFLLFISLIFDPTGEFYNLKYISVLFSFFIFGITFLLRFESFQLSKKQILYIVVFCLLMPIYGLSITLLNTNLTNFTDTSYIGFSLMLFLLLPLVVVPIEKFIYIFIE